MADERRHVVRLTDQQINFLRGSLDYSARAIRDHDYEPADPYWVDSHRRETEEMITSIRSALAEGSATN